MMSLVLTPATIALCVCVPLLAYFLVKKVFEKDTEVENRRRGAAKLAAKLQEIGLRKLPEFLIDYSVGDYTGMANRIHMLAELLVSGDAPVLAEVANELAQASSRNPLQREPPRIWIGIEHADDARPLEQSGAARFAQDLVMIALGLVIDLVREPPT